MWYIYKWNRVRNKYGVGFDFIHQKLNENWALVNSPLLKHHQNPLKKNKKLSPKVKFTLKIPMQSFLQNYKKSYKTTMAKYLDISWHWPKDQTNWKMCL